MPPLIVLLAALRYYASGSILSVLGDTMLISQATYCRSIQTVTRSLCRNAHKFIKWPGIEAQNKLKEKFYAIAGNL